ncbi:hypothetical protein B0H14DRAFT_2597241 [Mycena olivaceomarginata]|nr:hypothetical protein B0H14DRAFT_2597241 [Mycena olivaceomarginata]
MQICIYAMYGQDKTLRNIPGLLFVVEIIAEFGITIAKLVSDHDYQVNIVSIPGLKIPLSFCNKTIPKYLFALPIPLMGYEFILFALALYKVGFEVNLLNTLVWALSPYDLFTLGTAWGITVPALAATHVLINMREIYNHPFDTKATEDTMGIEFQAARWT